MKPQLLARMDAATELVRRRDLDGAMAIIRSALIHAECDSPSARDSTALQSRRQMALTALPSQNVVPTESAESNRFTIRPPLGRRARQPLPDILTALKRPPFANGLALRKHGRVAPDPLPEGATFNSHLFVTGSAQRRYKLYVPSHPADAPRPLVVMLHGCTQDADDFAIGTKMNRLGEELNVLIAYPEQSSTANNLKCWSWFSPTDQRRETGEPAVIAGITRAIAEKYQIDPARIFVAGLSAGGAMAVVMGKTYPDLFSAVGVHSGLPYQAATDVPSAFAVMRNGHLGTNPPSSLVDVPVSANDRPRYIIFHGGADATVHPGNGERLFMEACERKDATVKIDNKLAGSNPSFRRWIATTSAGTTIAEYWTIPDGGHAWSGGDARGSYVSEHGPDASREMMRFFLEGSARKTFEDR